MLREPEITGKIEFARVGEPSCDQLARCGHFFAGFRIEKLFELGERGRFHNSQNARAGAENESGRISK